MRLYLVQHGEAKSKKEDPERPLSNKGLQNIQQMARYAKHHLNIKIEQIVHSGKLRAKQTAEILEELLTPSYKIVGNKDLEPLADPKIWQKRLAEITGDTMLVGHLPHLSKLVSILLIQDEDREVITFREGVIICLEYNQQNHWIVQYIITPDTIPEASV